MAGALASEQQQQQKQQVSAAPAEEVKAEQAAAAAEPEEESDDWEKVSGDRVIGVTGQMGKVHSGVSVPVVLTVVYQLLVL